MRAINRLLLTLVISAFLVACSVPTEHLSAEVQKSMEEKFQGKNITIKSFMLSKKGGNEYFGVLETIEPFGEFTYSVKVIYDGKTFAWEIIQ